MLFTLLFIAFCALIGLMLGNCIGDRGDRRDGDIRGDVASTVGFLMGFVIAGIVICFKN